MRVTAQKIACLVACLLLAYFLLGERFVTANFGSTADPHQGSSLRKKVPAPRIAPRTVYAPILALDDPSQAELTLNNNGTQELPVSPTLFTREGELIQCSPVVVGPLQVQTLPISELIPKAERNRIGAASN
jgi:hypothetical protein